MEQQEEVNEVNSDEEVDSNGQNNDEEGSEESVDYSEEIRLFMEFTGSSDADIAAQYVQAAEGNVEEAVDTFLSGLPPSPLLFSLAPAQTSSNAEDTNDEVVEEEVETSSRRNNVRSVAVSSHDLEALLEAAQNMSRSDGTGSRLHDLTSRLLRMSRRGGLADLSVSLSTNSGVDSFSVSDYDNLIPEKREDLLKFDDLERVVERLEDLKTNDKLCRTNVFEIGNFAIFSTALTEFLCDYGVMESLILPKFEESIEKGDSRLSIRLLQTIEALTRSVLTGVKQSRNVCEKWFVPPRRVVHSFLGGGRGVRGKVVDLFISDILPANDIEKLEHLWLSEKFDPSWRDQEYGSEVLSIALRKGCSIPLLKQLVSNVNGCRANVNPDPDRVGKLKLPLLEAARAEGVKEENRERWSSNAVSILLDYGASVDVIDFSELETDQELTIAAKDLIFDEKMNVRKKSNQVKGGDMMLDKEVSLKFIESSLVALVPVLLKSFFEANAFPVKFRALDVITKIVILVRKFETNSSSSLFRLFDGNIPDLFKLFDYLLQNVESEKHLKVLVKLVEVLLGPTDLLKGCSEENFKFEIWFKEKLRRFGFFERLQNISSIAESSLLEQVLNYNDLNKNSVIEENLCKRLERLSSAIRSGDDEKVESALKQLATLLTEDCFSVGKEHFGLTAFEFEKSNLVQDILHVFENKSVNIFEYFAPPLQTVDDQGEEKLIDASDLVTETEQETAEETQKEDESAPVVEAELSFAKFQNNVSSVSIGEYSESNSLVRLISLAQGVFSRELQNAKNISIDSQFQVKNLADPFESHFRVGNFHISLTTLPITPVQDIVSQILRTADVSSNQMQEISQSLVGRMIKLKPLGSALDEFDLGVIAAFDKNTNAHLVKTIIDKTYSSSIWLNLSTFEVQVGQKVLDSNSLALFETLQMENINSVGNDKQVKIGDKTIVWFNGNIDLLRYEKDQVIEPCIFPGWYEVSVEKEIEDEGETLFSLKLNLSASDLFVKKGDVVKINGPRGLTGKVLFMKQGYLILENFESECFHYTAVSKVIKNSSRTGESNIFLDNVSSKSLFTYTEVYESPRRFRFEVYLRPLEKTKNESKKESMTFSVGSRVHARYAGKSRWYPGTLVRENLDGTFDITYDDADSERHVPKKYIANLGMKRTERELDLKNCSSFSSLFPTHARKKLFELLRGEVSSSRLQTPSQYNFLSRGFKDQITFEEVFTFSLRKKGMGLFARFQTYEQAMNLAEKLNNLSPDSLGIDFQLQTIVEVNEKSYIKPKVLKALNEISERQETKLGVDYKVAFKSLQKKVNSLPKVPLTKLTRGTRVQVQVQVEAKDKEMEIRWVAATVLGKEKNQSSFICVLDDGTVLPGILLSNMSFGSEKAEYSFTSSERTEVKSPVKEVSSPLRRSPKRRKQRKEGLSLIDRLNFSLEEEIEPASSQREPRSNRFADLMPIPLSDSNMINEVRPSLEGLIEEVDFLGAESEDSEEEREGDNVVVSAANELGSVILSRKFTAFGESLSYKHLTVSSAISNKLTQDFADKENVVPDFELDEAMRLPEICFKFSYKDKSVVFTRKSEEMSLFALFYKLEIDYKQDTIFPVIEVELLISCKTEDTMFSYSTIFQSKSLKLLSSLYNSFEAYSEKESLVNDDLLSGLPWKNTLLNSLLSSFLRNVLAVGCRLDSSFQEEFLRSFGFMLTTKLKKDFIKCTKLGLSRAISFLQDNHPGYMVKKKRLAQITLELSSVFSAPVPDLAKYDQLQVQLDKLDEEVKRIEEENFIGKLNEDLIKVERENLVTDAESYINLHSNSRSRLIVQFAGESSSGEGVTSDFYTSIAAELQQKKHNKRTPLFVDLDRNENSTNEEIKASVRGLFIQPLSPAGFFSPEAKEFEAARKRNESVLKRFNFLGQLFGKAFLDGHNVPLPLSKDFFLILKERYEKQDLLSFFQGAENLERRIIDSIEGYEDFEGADGKSGFINNLGDLLKRNDLKEARILLDNLCLAFCDFSQPIASSQEEHIEAAETKENEVDSVRSIPELDCVFSENPTQEEFNTFAKFASENGCSQQEIEAKLQANGASKAQTWKALSLSQHIRNERVIQRVGGKLNSEDLKCSALVANGESISVTLENVNEFLVSLKTWWLNEGICPVLDSFLNGLREILKESMEIVFSCFSAEELKIILCGEEDIKWKDDDPLLGFLVPMGKYTKDSTTIKTLVEVLKEMSTKERSLFLNFATAQSRVPLSGLPKIKIYPPLNDDVVGIVVGFALPMLTTNREIKSFETAMREFIKDMFKEGDAVSIRSSRSFTAKVKSWDPSSKKLLFHSRFRSNNTFQTGQIIDTSAGQMKEVLKRFKAEVAVKEVIASPSVIQCDPYLRPKATTCAKAVYLPSGYKDKEHMASVFREAFEDARLGGIHD